MSEINLKDALFNNLLLQYSSNSNTSTTSSNSNASFETYFNNSKTNYTQNEHSSTIKSSNYSNKSSNDNTNNISNINNTQNKTSNTKENIQTETSSTKEHTQTETSSIKENVQAETSSTKENVQTETSDTKENVQAETSGTKENVQTETDNNDVFQNKADITIQQIADDETFVYDITALETNINEVFSELTTNEENLPEISDLITPENSDILKEFIEELKTKVNENAYMVLLYDPNLLNQISEILQISTEDIIQNLSEMEMTFSDLTQTENLIHFMQKTLDLESPEMLISVDNIKEEMIEITEIASNVSHLENITVTKENIEQVIEDLSNLQQELLPVAIPEIESNDKVSTLLQDLNGEVIETSEQTYDILQVPYQEDLGGNLENNNQNMFGQSGDFEQNFNKSEIADFSSDINLQGSVTISNEATTFNSISQKVVSQRSVNPVEVINQIMDKIKTSVKTDVSEVKLLLRPDSLGEVSLKISTQSGLITAEFIAESQKVKEIIESNFSQLKDMLNEQGIEVSQLDVNVKDENLNDDSKRFEQLAFVKEKSEERVKDIIDKVLQEESITEYVEDNEVITSNVNYSA